MPLKKNASIQKINQLAVFALVGFFVATIFAVAPHKVLALMPVETPSTQTTTFRDALYTQKAYLEQVRTIQKNQAYLTDAQVQEQYENLERTSLYQGATFRTNQLGISTRIRLGFINIMLFVTTSIWHTIGAAIALILLLVFWFNIHFKSR